MKKLALLLSLLVATPVLAVPAVGVTNATKTTGTLNLFVDPAGNDSFSCLSLVKACLTIQGAFNKIPKPFIRHPVTIQLSAGSYAGAVFFGFNFDPVDPNVSGYVRIIGTEGVITPASGLATGTIASATVGSISTTTWGTATVTGAGWTVNDLRGVSFQITGGTGAGQIRTIASNTATVVTIASSFSPVPDATSTFALVNPTTKITSIVGAYATPHVAADPTFGAGLIFASEGTLPNVFKGGPISVERIWFDYTGGANIGVQTFGSAGVNVLNCKFTQMGRALGIHGTSGNGGAMRGYSNYSTASTVFANFTAGASAAAGYLEGNVINGGGTATGVRVFTGGWAGISTGANYFFNVLRGHYLIDHARLSAFGDVVDCNNTSNSTGIEIDPGFPVWAVTGSGSYSNCTTGAKATGKPGYLILNNTSGSGNTTGISASKGASINVFSNTTLTGATEISVDGASSTLATLRGATPKHLKDTNFFTTLFE